MRNEQGRAIKYEYDWQISSNPKCPTDYRFTLQAKGDNPLVAIAMNPSAATEEFADKTVNTIARASIVLGMSGWCVFNAYPEYSVDSSKLVGDRPFELIEENVQALSDYLNFNSGVSEIWLAWGASKAPLVREGAQKILECLYKNFPDIKLFCFPWLKEGTTPLTSDGSPRHPTPHGLPLDIRCESKCYLKIVKDGSYKLLVKDSCHE